MELRYDALVAIFVFVDIDFNNWSHLSVNNKRQDQNYPTLLLTNIVVRQLIMIV